MTGHGIRNVLVIGSSTGYGLASRIVAGWGLGCRTLGVFLERPPAGRRTATAGYYNSVALHEAAERDGLWVRSVNGDAFSDEVKDQVARLVADEMGPIDLLVYSLASPKRINPRAGTEHSSTIKSVGAPYSGKTVSLSSGSVEEASIEAATPDETAETVAVMGGEDWQWWIDRLSADNLLAPGARTVAYTYYGPELTWPIYRDGTIGAAKTDLKATADRLHGQLQSTIGGSAWLAVNKAVVTQASVAIPVVSLYVSLLFKAMKDRGLHEGCIEQMDRLFVGHLGSGHGPVLDADRLIRMDDLEMREDVQEAVAAVWPQVDSDTLKQLADFDGYRRDFSNLFGFEVEGVDYKQPVETQVLLSG